MSRSIFLAAVFGLGLSVAPTLHAQASSLPRVQAAVLADDSLYYAAPTNRMATVVITAEADTSDAEYRGIRGRMRARNDIRTLSRENRSLEIQLARYDARIETLENRLTYLKTVVTDSLVRATDKLDSTTAGVRARRLELEARIREMEAKNAVPVLATAPSDSSLAKKANE